MENAIDALKLATAVIIFVLAISLTYMLFSQTKSTADTIFYTRDSQKYMEQEGLEGIVYTSSGVETNRTVNLQDIITTLYRYQKENYGVTIIVKDGAGGYKVYARYDITTEDRVNIWSRRGMKDEDINSHIDYLNEITPKQETGNPYIVWNKDILENIYKAYDTNIRDYVVTIPWLSDETAIERRISADISGKDQTYNSEYKYNKNVSSNPCYRNLLEDYGEKNFIEIIKTIDNNEYVKIEESEGHEVENQELLQERLISKTEIIYVEE